MKVTIYTEEDFIDNELVTPVCQMFRRGINLLKENKDDNEAVENLVYELQMLLLVEDAMGTPGQYTYVDPRDLLKEPGNQRILVGTDEDELKQVMKELGL